MKRNNDNYRECTFRPKTNKTKVSKYNTTKRSVFESTGVKQHVDRQLGKV